MKKHKHAELMALYARDAAETETPWEMWECRYKAEWEPCDCEIGFFTTCDYRRKPDDLSEAVNLATAIHDRCYPGAVGWNPESTVSGVLSQISNMVAGMFDCITDLQAWKCSAIECSPPLQEIGRALNLVPGTDVPTAILPGILSLKERLERERIVRESLDRHISKALDNAGVPTHRPYIGTTAPKPMTPLERIDWLAQTLLEYKSWYERACRAKG